MTRGIAVYSELGNLTYTTSDVTWNQVDFVYVAANTTFDQSYPILSGHEVLVVQSTINPPPTDQRAYVHTITVSGTQVYATGANVDTYLLVLMR